MTSPNSNPKTVSDSRPRLLVVLPLLVVCFGVIWLSVWNYFIPSRNEARPVSPDHTEPDLSSTQSSEPEGSRRAATAPVANKQLLPSSGGPNAVIVPSNESKPIAEATPNAFSSPSSAPPQGSLTPVSVRANEAPEISGRIRLKGTPAPEKELPLDASCAQLHQIRPATRFYLTDAEGGLADVFVYIKEGLHGKRSAAPVQPILLDQVGCEYTPYVLGLQTGQLLLVRNSDPVMHNVHSTPANSSNAESNRAHLPKGKDLEFRFHHPEVFLRFRCDVHPWMFAYVGIVEHPFFTVSGRDGTFALPDIPPGKYTIEAYHRKAGKVTREIIVQKGEPVAVDFLLEVPAADSQ